MQLFDIIKLIFSQKQKDWEKVPRVGKIRNFFMINRIMGIQYPLQANQFNKLKVDPSNVVDWWHDSLSHRFTKPPSWIFAKTIKKEKSATEFGELNSETEKFLMGSLSVSSKDLKLLQSFYPEKYASWIDDVSDQLGFKK